jgi:hypothetical protein
MAVVSGPKIVDNGADLILDVSNSRSYPGSGTTLIDIIGNRSATIESAQVVNLNTDASSVQFAGGSQRVSLDYSGTGVLGSNQDIDVTTIECVFQLDTINQFQNLIQIGTASDGLSVGITDENVIRFVLRKGGTGLNTNNDRFIETNRVLESGVWYHAVCVLSDTEQSVYINAEKLKTNNVSNFTWNTGSTGGIQIGSVTTQSGLRGSVDTTETFNGKISTIRIYNRALTDTEITNNFYALQNRFSIDYDVLDLPILFSIPTSDYLFDVNVLSSLSQSALDTISVTTSGDTIESIQDQAT